MAKSLQEQMLKMGLVDKQRANKAKKEVAKKNKQKKNNKIPVQDESKQQAQNALAEKAKRDRQLNLQRKELAEQKAITAQIKQLIQLNRIKEDKEGEAFNFTDQKKIKTIYISDMVRDQIGNGRLAIVTLENKYNIIPTKIAEKIQQRDPGAVIILNKKEQKMSDENDPYAEFQVPDDLMW